MANIKNKKNIRATVFLSHARKISETFYTAVYSYSTKVMENGAEVKKYVNMQVESKIDLTEFMNKRVQISGFLKGHMYKGTNTFRVFITAISEKEKGGTSSVELTTRTKFIKEGTGDQEYVFAGGSMIFNASRQKDVENMQFVNFQISGNRHTLSLVDNQQVTLKGYFVAKYVPAYEDNEAFTKLVFVASQVLEREGNSTQTEAAPKATQTETAPKATQTETAPKATQTETAPKAAPAQASTAKTPDEVFDEEEIPF